MNVSSTYLSDNDGFSDIDPNAISLQYSKYTLANTGDNGDPIDNPSGRDMTEPISKYVVPTQKVIYWDTGAFFQRGSCNLSRITDNVSSVGIFVNRFTTSRHTICLE